MATNDELKKSVTFDFEGWTQNEIDGSIDSITEQAEYYEAKETVVYMKSDNSAHVLPRPKKL